MGRAPRRQSVVAKPLVSRSKVLATVFAVALICAVSCAQYALGHQSSRAELRAVVRLPFKHRNVSGSSHLPPLATTSRAYEIRPRSAILLGHVNAHGQRTAVRFQYGRTTSYGHISPRYVEEVVIGSRNEEVEETILCLRPKTTYHFRIVARNRSGTVFGRDRKFTTRPEIAGNVEPCVRE